MMENIIKAINGKNYDTFRVFCKDISAYFSLKFLDDFFGILFITLVTS